MAATLLAACVPGVAGKPVVAPAASKQRLCGQTVHGTYGVTPLRNKTKRPLSLDGTDDLIAEAMLASGCFTLVERERIAALIEEMRLCSDDNPDRDYFDCGSFAQKGKLLGVGYLVFGDVVLAEDEVDGGALIAKFPGLGGVELGRTYSALAIALRVVEVETGRVALSSVVHARVPSDRAGASVTHAGVDVKAVASSATPMGEAIQTMLDEAVTRMYAAAKP